MDENSGRACCLAMYLLEAAIGEVGATVGDIQDAHALIKAVWFKGTRGQPFDDGVHEIMARHEADIALGLASRASKVDPGRS